MVVRNTLLLTIVVALLLAPAGARAQFVAERVADQVRDCVVTIEGVSVSLAAVSLTSRQQRILQSYSTGIVLDKKGHILTHASTLEDVEVLEVTLADGRKLEAEAVVQDEGYGLGLLKLKEPPADLKPAKLHTATPPVKQGESVVVVGTAGGFGHTLSYGIVSALRSVRLDSGQLVPDMIQSDVVVNTGNQGSPLFNTRAEVVGVHVIYGDRSALALQNISFFMPATLVKKVADQLIATGKPAFRPWLGIWPFSGSYGPTDFGYFSGVTELSDDLRMYMNLPDEYWDCGMLVFNVWEGSPAYDAGLRYQDFVVKVNGKLLKTIGELEQMVYEAEEGEVMVFGIIRRDRYLDVDLVVGNHPDEILRFYI